MLRVIITLGLLFTVVVCVPGCRKVEGTGRNQLLLISEGTESQLGLQAFQVVLQKEKRSTDQQAMAIVERVGRRIAAAAPQKGFQYEFVLLDSKEPNAFCLPGGKVCVYTGILEHCRDEGGLATVMSHEIAHAIARHGGERMSQGLIVEGLSTGLDAYLQSKGVSPTKTNVALAAFGAGTQIGVLFPYSRTHEYEADYLGLTYMAKAGYDPRLAEQFWDRFGKAGGSAPPSFLSTHPASADRARKMRENTAEALKHYEVSPKYGAGETVPAQYLK
jgi:predicted Zn-dependent protease